MTSSRLQILISAEQIRRRVEDLGREIARDFPDEPDAPPLYLVGALKGAAIFLADLARAIPRDVRIEFVQASSYGSGTESEGQVRILRDVPDGLSGCDFLLVEDIVDTGHTAAVLLDRIAQQQPRSVGVAALLSKPSRRVREVTIDYCGFEVPDQFVVGYGLDFDERYRNLPDVCVVEDSGSAR